MTGRSIGAVAVWVLLLAGCGGGKPPPPPAPRVVAAIVTAAPDVNPAPNNTPQPVAVRIYQLQSPAGFEAAQFFALFNDDKAVLKGDLVKRDDLLLAPGQSKDLELHPDNGTHAIGVFAAFRDFEKLSWHVSVTDIPLHGTSTLSVTAGKTGLSAKLEPPKPDKPGN